MIRYVSTLILVLTVLAFFSCGPSSDNNPEAIKTASKPISSSPTVIPGRSYEFEVTAQRGALKTLLAQDYESFAGSSGTNFDPDKYNYEWFVKNPNESGFFPKGTGIEFTYTYGAAGIYDVLLEVYDKASGQEVRSHLIKMTVQ